MANIRGKTLVKRDTSLNEYVLPAQGGVQKHWVYDKVNASGNVATNDMVAFWIPSSSVAVTEITLREVTTQANQTYQLRVYHKDGKTGTDNTAGSPGFGRKYDNLTPTYTVRDLDPDLKIKAQKLIMIKDENAMVAVRKSGGSGNLVLQDTSTAEFAIAYIPDQDQN